MSSAGGPAEHNLHHWPPTAWSSRPPPPRVHHRLTDLGRSLDEPLAALHDWAERQPDAPHRPATQTRLRHRSQVNDTRQGDPRLRTAPSRRRLRLQHHGSGLDVSHTEARRVDRPHRNPVRRHEGRRPTRDHRDRNDSYRRGGQPDGGRRQTADGCSRWRRGSATQGAQHGSDRGRWTDRRDQR